MGRKEGDTIKFVSDAIKLEAIGQVSDFACNYVRSYGTARPIAMSELIKETRSNLDVVYDIRAITFLAFYQSIPKIIVKAFNKRKKELGEGFFHCKGVSGKMKSGYMYITHKTQNPGEKWMMVYRSLMSRRNKWNEEKALILVCIDKVLNKIEEPKKREEIKEIKVLIENAKRSESTSDEEDEDEDED